MSFIANRLSLIVPPATAKPIRAKAKKKASKKSRMVVLKNFVDLPLDIIYETIAYLEPLDLLILARLSKEFRALFMSRSSLFIWKRVLGQVPNLPPCPQDLNEPQYASLVFEKFCMACGSSRGTIESDFKTRLRFCATCSKTNLIRGYELRAKYTGFQDVALTMLPFFACDFWILGSPGLRSAKNDLSMTYFKPEAELLLHQLAKHEDTDSDEYKRFVTQEQENASRMIDEALMLNEYEESLLDAREEAEDEMVERRYARIKEKIHTLGWEEKYFPHFRDNEDYDRWGKYMYQSKEFSERGWSLIRPKLEVIYHRTKKYRQFESLSSRTLQRYNTFRAAQPVEERRRLPMWGDLFSLDFMTRFFWNNYEECSEDKLTEQMQTIVDETQGFLEIIEHDLAGMIVARDPTQVLEEASWLVDRGWNAKDPEAMSEAISLMRAKASSSSSASTASPDTKDKGKDKGKGKAKASSSASAKDVLGRATNMFLCSCSHCMRRWDRPRAFSYPGVVDHVNEEAFSEHHWMRARPETNTEVMQVARDVLVALGLAEDSLHAEVDALGELVCDCRHHEFQGPLSFDQLVDHVLSQQTAYTLLLNATINDDEDILVNGHSRERLPDLVRVATDEDRVSSKNEDEDEDEEASVATVQRDAPTPHGTYCRYCYQLVLEGCKYTESMVYHLKYLHGKEFTDDAFESLDVLKGKYGLRQYLNVGWWRL